VAAFDQVAHGGFGQSGVVDAHIVDGGSSVVGVDHREADARGIELVDGVIDVARGAGPRVDEDEAVGEAALEDLIARGAAGAAGGRVDEQVVATLHDRGLDAGESLSDELVEEDRVLHRYHQAEQAGAAFGERLGQLIRRITEVLSDLTNELALGGADPRSFFVV
jgi:hypothetical protein